MNGVYSADGFLTRINLMHAYEFPRYDEPIVELKGKQVAVIGGGDTALDTIRSAGRLGADKAQVLYRRSKAEMPARAEEMKHAKQEGIDFQVLTNPVEFLDDGNGWLRAARCVRMELGEPDASGRKRPIAVAGSEFEIPLSVANVATGTSANPQIQSTTPGLKTNQRGCIEASSEDATHIAKGRVRWGRHRHGKRDGDFGYGIGATSGEIDPRVLDHQRMVRAPARQRWLK